ncbi:polysaccharide deacetylase family protein [Celeribacter indicus]|uniref:Chitooligosaccharide deacetylase n=1 Tax=Celeribacter indicus TaxID=1208324 RepID=A0A0B5DWP9_9RHOB|nr:polysaccharide deacetylase family protein [Celeribacter indicus]AJE47858.1 polysaccharide deacetylase family protein [Celeribacter indicus]SDW25136.1 Peptidoglycan/xylan/chitin deacetylase, PgdA/CDA1 family [Celeribacter indicus]
MTVDEFPRERIAYVPINRRPDLRWKNGARLAVWIVPNLEHYQYLGDPRQPVDPYPRMPHPDMLIYSQVDQGNRVGIWRMLEVMDRYGLPATCSLNLSVYETYPEIAEACEARGWEVMSHGIYNSRHHWGLSREAERAVIADNIARHKALTGREMKGFFAPFASSTVHTEALCAELGLQYYVDYGFDDQPTPVRVQNGYILAMPYSFDVNDGMNFRANIEAPEFAENTITMFDRLYRDSEARGGRVMCVPLHPFFFGQPHRAKYLDQILGHIAGHTDIWVATGGEINDWYRQHHLPKMMPLLRDAGFDDAF